MGEACRHKQLAPLLARQPDAEFARGTRRSFPNVDDENGAHSSRTSFAWCSLVPYVREGATIVAVMDKDQLENALDFQIFIRLTSTYGVQL